MTSLVKHKPKLAIVGGGIGGLSLTQLLLDRGYDVVIHEQASEIKPLGTGLSIMANAVLALKNLGREDLIRDIGEPMTTCEMRHSHTGKIICNFPVEKVSRSLGVESYCLHRGDLQARLLRGLSPETLKLGSRIISVRQEKDRVLLMSERGERFEYDAAIGADGFQSMSRKEIGLETPIRPTKFLAWLAIVEGRPEGFEPGNVQHFWGRGKRVGLVDIGNGKFYWWATINTSLIPSHLIASPSSKAITRDQVLEYFRDWHPSVRDTIARTEQNSILQIQTRDRVPISQCASGRIVLMGDAAHPMLTSMGQGAGVTIEDAAVLTKSLEEADGDFIRGFKSYESKQLGRANNFVRMSRQVAWHEQFQSAVAYELRNFIFRALPASFYEQQMRSMLAFDN